IIKDEVMGPVGNAQYRDYASDINNSGVHLLSLINDILDYSKAEAGKLEVEYIKMDLNKVVKSSFRLVLPRAKEAKINLVQDVPKEHVVLEADPKRMKQVILNLLSNSVKFTPEAGEVKLTLRIINNKFVKIDVHDTGIGISAKNISQAMSTFGQVDSSLSRRYEGTGLGLPFSKKLVEMMGGRFDIKSEEGLGTTITLRFPLTKGGAQQEIEKDMGILNSFDQDDLLR
ncbi:MAG: ATP-binding protein, partial [Rickettsiales bacterium]|nr:ATP-binding protein [Rickettsiales bacterium]